MSLSLDHEDATPEVRQKERFAAFAKMFGEGRSFSGHERNCCYLNPGNSPAANGRFANISAASGLDYPDDARAIALLDWDQDGDLDVWASNRNAPRLRLLRNEIPRSGNFVSLRLVGNGSTTNRDAIGARVEIISGTAGSGESSPNIATLRAGEGFLSQNSKWLHFGLGDHQQIDRVIVSWPGGEKETFTGVVANRRNRLTQGAGAATTIEPMNRELRLTADSQNVLEPSSSGTLRLVTPVAMPPIPYANWNGTLRQLDSKLDRPTLLVLWASWCQPCLKELQELANAKDRLARAGVDVIALAVDGIGTDKGDPNDARKILSKLKFPFRSERATEHLLEGLQKMHDRQAAVKRPLPLPASILLNRDRELTSIYKGPLQIDSLLADIEHLEDTPAERLAHASALPGRVINHDTSETILAIAESEQRFKTAGMFEKNKFWDQAIVQYDQIIELWMDEVDHQSSGIRGKGNHTASAVGHLQKRDQIQSLAYASRGQINQRKGNTSSAIEDFEAAVRIKPDNAQLYFALGNLNERLNRRQEAIEHFDNAIQYDPHYAEAYRKRARLYQIQGKHDAAADDLKQLAILRPDNPRIYSQRGQLLLLAGETDEALKCFSKALEIDPQNVDSLVNRGSLLAAEGKYEQAANDFSNAIKLNPDSSAAYNNFAWMLATCNDPDYRDGKRATIYATKACKLMDWKSRDTLDTLAAAAAESDDFQSAIKWQKQAISLDSDNPNDSLRRRLELYQTGNKYRMNSK
ncbi:MAG: tetratricopeptide repeat protein [Pirellulales bacterium]|nr:tetratricopeptide repeat protein [Pirellulales bacterium]